ncbi:MAG: outer membrane protein assembly factor [Longimicrobiales bacterium]
MTSSSLRIAIGAAVLGGAFALPVSAQAGRVEVTALSFSGNKSIASDSLANAIVNRRSECRSFVLAPFCLFRTGFARTERFLREGELARDIARLRLYYHDRGFREATVDTAIIRPNSEEIRIRFDIDEGRPVLISELAVTGVEGLDGLGLESALPLQVEERFSRIRLNAARDTLRLRLLNRGYPQADVFITSNILSGSYAASVTFDVDAGPYAAFGPISVSGNRRLSDRIIRRMLPFSEGDEYSREATLSGQRNLFNLEIISSAQVVDTLSVSRVGEVVPIEVKVAEGSVHRVRAGLGWSTIDCLNAEGRWTSRNFFGGARRLQLRARLSNILAEQLQDTVCGQAGVGEFGDLNWLVSADFTQPWIFSSGYSLSSGLFFERQSLQDVFVRKAVGIELGLVRRFRPGTTVTLSYRPQLTSLDAAEVFFCTSFLVCTPSDIDVLQSANWLAPVGISLAQDRTNRILNPTRGYSAVLDVELASGMTGSDFAYNRAFAQLAAYREARQGQVVAARVRGGWVGAGTFGLLRSAGDITHPQKRFYGGGPNSVRGFGQNQLGPRVLTVDVRRLIFPASADGGAACLPGEVMDLSCDASSLSDGRFDTPRPTGGRVILEASVEFRFPIEEGSFEVATFVDVGQVWSENEPIDLGNLQIAPGIGIRYRSPVGPIRVDLGYRTRGRETLQVVTSQIRPFIAGQDDPEDRLQHVIAGETRTLDYVLNDDLALLSSRVGFGEADAFSLSRLQLHFSIGQAF